MKMLNRDGQYVFRITLVEKLQFVRPNWNILFEISYDLTNFMQIITLLPVSKEFLAIRQAISLKETFVLFC